MTCTSREKVALLADIKAVFESRRVLATEELVGKVNTLDGSFAIELRNGMHLAGYLAPFRIRPKRIRLGARTVRGYERQQFEDAWRRYLP